MAFTLIMLTVTHESSYSCAAGQGRAGSGNTTTHQTSLASGSNCYLCAQGYYSTSGSGCQSCAGVITQFTINPANINNIGGQNCKPCSAGQNASNGCQACSKGYYSNSSTNFQCVACSGTTTIGGAGVNQSASSGATGCGPSSCPAGQGLSNNTCSTCPANSYQNGTSAFCKGIASNQVPTLNGKNNYGNTGSTGVTTCQPGSEVVSKAGSTTMCAVCNSKQYSSDGTSCTSCNAKDHMIPSNLNVNGGYTRCATGEGK